jgi:hypothetical protein
MRKIWWLLCVLVAPVAAHAQSCALPVGFSASQFNTATAAAINAACTGTPAPKTVLWPAGTTTLSSALSVPCSGNASSPVVIMGPVDANTSPLSFTHPTAIANTSAIGLSDALNIASGCTGLEIHGLQINGSGGFSINGDSSYINLHNNEVIGIPDTLSGSSCCSGPHGVDVNGFLATSTSVKNGQTIIESYDHDIQITGNIFGDAASCPNGAAGNGGSPVNDGCGGVQVGIGEAQNFTISGNYIYHLVEGIHFPPMSQFNGTRSNGVCDNCVISNNYITTIFRNPVEFQYAVVNHPFLFQHNAFYGVNQKFSSVQIGFTLPCCQQGFFQNTQAPSPGAIESDNVFVTLDRANQENYGYEFWGNGPINQYNLVEGQVANPVTYGFWGTDVGTIRYDYLCWEPGYTGSGFITNEEGQAAPNQTGNVTSTSCQATTSIAPNVSPASTASPTYPLAVTMAIPQTTTSYNTGQNTSIYYTIDGSAPVPGAGNTKLYTGTITLTGPATVKAVGMWGTGPAPLTWPTGYGYVPSAPTTATYGAGGTAPSLSSITLALPQSSLTTASATETATVMCNYANGSSYSCGQSMDFYGSGPATFTSSNSAAATVSSGGVITPIAVGDTNITATVNVLHSLVPLSVSAAGGGGGTSGGTTVYLGQNQENYSGSTYVNAFNSVYSVTPATGGPWTPGACHFYILGTVQSGKHWDCLIIAAPSATTEASTPLCKATYTTTSTTGPGQVNIPPTGCGTLANSTAFWAATITDDTSNPAGLGFNDCGGSCAGSAPGAGAGPGTYPGYWVSNAYGSYTALPSSFGGTNPRQPSLWVDLASGAVTLTGAYQGNLTNLSTMVKGAGTQMHAYCTYSDNVVLQCDTTDARGDAVTAWGVTALSGTVLSIQNVGGSSPGLVTGVNYGQGTSTCTINGSVQCQPWLWNIINMPATVDAYTGVKLSGMQVQ